jgi:hypothetical protein
MKRDVISVVEAAYDLLRVGRMNTIFPDWAAVARGSLRASEPSRVCRGGSTTAEGDVFRAQGSHRHFGAAGGGARTSDVSLQRNADELPVLIHG